jgi:hypothetical protein
METLDNNPSDIDLAPYVSPMRFDGQHGIVLAAQLGVAASADLGPRGKAMLARVGTMADRVTAVLVQRGKTSAGGLRPIILAFDTAYSALSGRLSSAAKLPASAGDVSARATAVLDAVLVDGLTFLVNDAETKYAESVRRLLVIEEAGLDGEIDRIAGAGYLDAVKAAHAALGEAIGVGRAPVRYARAELQDAVLELAQAIADYCLQVAGEVDRYDAASVARFRAAMMPIDRFRADRAASPGGEEGDHVKDAPVVAAPTGSTTPVTATPTVVHASNGTPLPSPFITDAAE